LSAAALLADLSGRGIRLLAAGGRLTYEAPPGVLSDSDRRAIAAAKPALVQFLDSPSPPRAAPAEELARLVWRRFLDLGGIPTPTSEDHRASNRRAWEQVEAELEADSAARTVPDTTESGKRP
jgi:hypothetical protein